ncbi:MAG: hypothetical protein GY726_11865 [Proteobacteria bacterium]|nr:hypothetical protein [Pseudomonadota bacterium]
MNNKSNDSRRKLLKSIAAGSGAVVAGKSLPDSWSKPVIDTVMIPAHAETTNDNESDVPAVLCGGCYHQEGVVPVSYDIPEGLQPGIVQSEVKQYFDSPDCSGDQYETHRSGRFALARNETEAEGFLGCSSIAGVVSQTATLEGSECSLWECDD